MLERDPAGCPLSATLVMVTAEILQRRPASRNCPINPGLEASSLKPSNLFFKAFTYGHSFRLEALFFQLMYSYRIIPSKRDKKNGGSKGAAEAR